MGEVEEENIRTNPEYPDCMQNGGTALDKKEFNQSKSLLYMISSFIMDLGVAGFLKLLKNGINYKLLYDEFCDEHPKAKISLADFENYVVESIKRIGSAIAAEIAAVPGSMAGSAIVALSSLPKEDVGLFAFSGSILANFLAFAGVWAKSHSHKFVKENGGFDVKRFAKTLAAEYSVHFGFIAIGADLLESFIIQLLANNDLNFVFSSAVVTSIGSTLAVSLYFYEQQIRINVKNMEIGKIAVDTRNRVCNFLAPMSFEAGKVFR